MLDRDGQPLAGFNRGRNKRKALAALVGLLSGIAADRRLVPEEAVLLDTWLREHEALRGDPDVVDILDLTGDILADGVVTAEELDDLLGLVDTVLEYRAADIATPTDLSNQLQGLVKGITADRRLHDLEIVQLNGWLEVAGEEDRWPFNLLRRRVEMVLADGVVDAEERVDLLALLDGLHGGALPEMGIASGMSTTLPIDTDASVVFSQMTFCPTGKFVFGSRSKVERAIVERGGAIAGVPTKKTNFLVVGSLASRDWATTTYGRKIEAALALQASGMPIVIVGEATLVAAL